MKDQEQENNKPGNRLKRYLKFILKIAITGLALFYISTKIDFKEVGQEMARIHPLWYLLAIISFHISKIISAFRIREFYKILGINIGDLENIKLYYIGMFYNLFLPGSIGGDGYKVYLLKRSSGIKTRYLISSALLDRLSGLALLVLLACILFLGTEMPALNAWLEPVVWVLLIASLPALFFGIRIFFSRFLPAFRRTTMLSFFVQLGQILCAFCILKALHIQDAYFDYLALFMVSSVVAVIPFTIGGVGARELVFLYGYEYLNIDSSKAIGFTLLFFIALALTSLTGMFFSLGSNKLDLSVEEPDV